MTDLPDDEPQPGSRAWMEQTAQLDSAMATARRYLSALNAQDHPACNAILVELACDRVIMAVFGAPVALEDHAVHPSRSPSALRPGSGRVMAPKRKSIAAQLALQSQM